MKLKLTLPLDCLKFRMQAIAQFHIHLGFIYNLLKSVVLARNLFLSVVKGNGYRACDFLFCLEIFSGLMRKNCLESLVS